MAKFDVNDIVGTHIGELYIVKYLKYIDRGKGDYYHLYQAQCSCGKLEAVRRNHLKARKRRCLACNKKNRFARLKRIMKKDVSRAQYIPKMTMGADVK